MKLTLMIENRSSQQMSSASGALEEYETKLEAAKMALNSGAETWVASGLDDDTLLRNIRVKRSN